MGKAQKRKKFKRKGTNLHHVIPKSDGGKGLEHNRMRLPLTIHCLVHILDRMVDRDLVKKDGYYYLQIIAAAYAVDRGR